MPKPARSPTSIPLVRWTFVVVTMLSLSACTRDGTTSGVTTSSSAATTTAATTATASSPTPPPSSETVAPSPVPRLPAGLPPSFGDDVPSADVPAAALIPLQTEVTGSWSTSTAAGEAIMVAWQVPGDDPFRLARGFAIWRRFDDGGPPWRPVYGVAYARNDGVRAVTALMADVTGDRSEDALVFAETGGSGGCGTYSVVDLAAGIRIFRRQVCDTQIDPSSVPVGLVMTEAVYEPGDPHCCPSATRETVLTYAGDGGWVTASETVTPTG